MRPQLSPYAAIGDAPSKTSQDRPAQPPTLLWPVYEFRPLPTALPRGWPVRRYADGRWLLDDGEYDLAFVAHNLCLMVELPYQRNIIWKGLTTHWSANDWDHPRGNPWHHMLRVGAEDWGGSWDRDRHPNTKAGNSGMDWACGQHRCANGRHVELTDGDPHIAAGLVRERESGAIVRPPEQLRCMYCGDGWAAKKARALVWASPAEGTLDGSSPQKDEAQ